MAFTQIAPERYRNDATGEILTESQMRAAGGAPASGGTSPAGLAAAFQPADVTLPGADAAKQGLRDLQTQSVGGLSTLLGQDPQARRDALTKALYENAASDINYSADRLARDAREGQSAKNFLTSSATGDYFLDPIERNRTLGLERAANDAFTQANAIGNANATTQAQILGQAFNSGTTGLQGEANVENANAARQQQGTEAGYQIGSQLSESAANRAQQNTQFGQSLGQQRDLQTQAFQNARDISSSNALAGGIGAGIGGLAQLFAPTANSALKSYFGLQ